LVDILLTQIKKIPNKLLNNNLLGIFFVDQPVLPEWYYKILFASLWCWYSVVY